MMTRLKFKIENIVIVNFKSDLDQIEEELLQVILRKEDLESGKKLLLYLPLIESSQEIYISYSF